MYDSPSRNKGPSFSFTSKPSPSKPLNTPGPGNYENQPKGNGQAFKIGSSSRGGGIDGG